MSFFFINFFSDKLLLFYEKVLLTFKEHKLCSFSNERKSIMKYKVNNIKHCPIKDLTTVTVTSKFGPRTFYNKIEGKYESGHHNGIDIIGGDIIVTPYDGVVTKTRNGIIGYSTKDSCGNYVTIDHGNGYTTVYYHLKLDSIKVKKGERVSAGQEIALMGNTGHSISKHLHYGIKKNNVWIDPENFLTDTNSINNTGYLNEENNNDNKEIIYVVKKGDNLTKIAKKYNTTWQSIYKKNKELIGNNPNLIHIGWKLKI